MKKPNTNQWMVGLAALMGLLSTSGTFVRAADHLDPPGRTNPDASPAGRDRPADIADVYTWHRGTGAAQTLVTILSFDGPNAPAYQFSCDRNVLYNIHIDNNGDNTADRTFQVRFGRAVGAAATSQCFAQFSGIPGLTGSTNTRVGRTVTRGTTKLYAGVRDDAFFFDLQGFRQTVSSGTLSFVNDRDFFAGKNTPAIAIETAMSGVVSGTMPLRIWATTARIGTL